MSNTLGNVEIMTNEQLVIRIKAHMDEADNMLQLWQQNKGFIYKTAKKYSQYVEMDDLLQEGYLGLCEAVRHYEPEQGTLFMTYAAFWIKQQIYRYVENCCSVVRISSGTRGEVLHYKKIYAEYRKWYGKDPSDKEMKAFLGVSIERLEDIKKALRMSKIESLSKPIGGEEEDLLLSDMAASDEDIEEDVISRLDKEQVYKDLWEVVDGLPEKSREVIKLRYQERMTFKEIAESMGENKYQVCNHEDRGLRLLRHPNRSRVFQAYYEEYLSPAPIHHVSVGKFNRTWTSSVEAEILRRCEVRS